MSVIIIGTGGRAILAVHALIGASMIMKPDQIKKAESLLDKFYKDVEDLCFKADCHDKL